MHVGRINVTIANEPGNLGSLTTTIGKQGGNISNLKITNRSTDFFEIMVDIQVARREAAVDDHRRAARDAGHQLGRTGARLSGMILGVGSDLIDIRRIEKTIVRYGERFLDRIFTETERRHCDRRSEPRRQLRPPLRRQGGSGEGARHRVSSRRFLAGSRGRQPAVGPAGNAVDWRCAGAARGDHPAGDDRACGADHHRRAAACSGARHHHRGTVGGSSR